MLRYSYVSDIGTYYIQLYMCRTLLVFHFIRRTILLVACFYFWHASTKYQIEAIIQDDTAKGSITNIDALNTRLENQVLMPYLSKIFPWAWIHKCVHFLCFTYKYPPCNLWFLIYLVWLISNTIKNLATIMNLHNSLVVLLPKAIYVCGMLKILSEVDIMCVY